MSMQWFRMYAEFANDPKVQMLGEVDQRRFVMLLCLRCSNGDVTLHDDEVAFQLRVTPDEWSRTKAVLMQKNMITDCNQPTAWERRQFVSDSSRARVAAHRERKKRSCNVTQKKCNAPDTDTDTDTDTEDKNVVVLTDVLPCSENALVNNNVGGPHSDAVTPEKTKKSATRKTKLPADVTLTDEWITAAKAIDPSCNVRLTFETFRDYWHGTGKPMANWLATWRNWIRRNAQFAPRPGPRQYEPTAVQHRRI